MVSFVAADGETALVPCASPLTLTLSPENNPPLTPASPPWVFPPHPNPLPRRGEGAGRNGAGMRRFCRAPEDADTRGTPPVRWSWFVLAPLTVALGPMGIAPSPYPLPRGGEGDVDLVLADLEV